MSIEIPNHARACYTREIDVHSTVTRVFSFPSEESERGGDDRMSVSSLRLYSTVHSIVRALSGRRRKQGEQAPTVSHTLSESSPTTTPQAICASLVTHRAQFSPCQAVPTVCFAQLSSGRLEANRLRPQRRHCSRAALPPAARSHLQERTAASTSLHSSHFSCLTRCTPESCATLRRTSTQCCLLDASRIQRCLPFLSSSPFFRDR